MLKKFKKQVLMISSVVCALGLVGCSNKAVPQSSETTVVAENKENNESSKALEKAIDAVAFSYVKSQLAETNPKATPGAQIVVLKDGKIVFKKSYGTIQAFDFSKNPAEKIENPSAVTDETLFDLASVTKISATTQVFMHLVYEGKVKLDDKVTKYLPEFGKNGKEDVTIGQLLSHTSGLPQWKAIYLYSNNRQDTLKYIEDQKLEFKPGEYKYSDLGYMTLAFIAEKITGEAFDKYVAKTIYEPLEMKNTMFNPTKNGVDKSKIAVTSYGNPFEKMMIDEVNFPKFGYDMTADKEAFEKFNGWRNYELQGEVNDGNAFMANEGYAGHAGLFSTATDLSTLYQVLVDKGKRGDTVLYDEKTVELFLQDVFKTKSGSIQSYGYLKNAGWMQSLAEDAIGHNGFTGTYVTISPKNKIVVIVLTNKMNNGQQKSGNYSNTHDFASAVNYAVHNEFLSEK